MPFHRACRGSGSRFIAPFWKTADEKRWGGKAALAAAISMLRNRAETKRPKQSASAFAPR